MASTPGLGSTVSLVLPACTDSPASAVQDQPAAGPGRQAAAGAGAGAGLHGLHGLHGAQGMQARPGDGDSPPKADAATGAPTSPPLLHGASVLLVEDSEELAEVTVMLLQSYGCRVRRARHVDDALAQVQADPTLQLVLTDVVMPGARDGVDLARELRRTRPQLPVVLISGYSAALTGLTGFTVLRKPVAAEQLVRTLAAALRGESPAVKTET
jgi:CheY-like chemotaxis protein